jgi:hypothetical protein
MQQKMQLSTVDAARPDQSRPGGGLGLRHLLLFLWGACIACSVFYIFPSGYPQPADAVMAILIAILFTGYFARIPKHTTLYLTGAAFLTVVAVVNWSWYTQYPDLKFLFSSCFYLYDFCVVIVIITMAKQFGHRFVKVTRISLTIAIIMEIFALTFLTEFRGIRGIGTFNNPNQLGYFSLLALACVFVMKGRAKLDYGDLALIVMLGYVSMYSLSKAAMISLLGLALIGIWGQGMNLRPKLALVLLLVIAGSFIAIKWQQMQGREFLTYRVVNRIETIGAQSDDSAAGRGYDRIWKYPGQMILGAGEGGYERFVSQTNEMHSTFGTVLFSYGILGSTFFLAILWRVFRRASFWHLLYFGPICLYGLTHQGLRFTLLWVFLGLVFSAAHYDLRAPVTPRTRQIAPPVRLESIGQQRGRRSVA